MMENLCRSNEFVSQESWTQLLTFSIHMCIKDPSLQTKVQGLFYTITE